MKGIGDIMKQAQQMQERMQNLNKELQNAEVIGESGAGLVKVIMTGRHEAKSVVLDPELFQEDQQVVEDLIAAAINDAARKIEKAQKDKMAELTGGLGLPPGFQMPI